MTRILHISDTHGTMPPLVGDFDVVVHSGDFCSNRTFGIRSIEETFQPHWLNEKAAKLRAWLGSKPVLVCSGNHDFVPVVPHLRAAGIAAHSLDDALVDIDGVSFYGFPWTPPFFDWNWMCGPIEMRHRLVPAIELMEQGGIDVFVAHGPMYGVLDRNQDGERCGSKVVREVMQSVRHAPRALLHGHIHESAGLIGWSRGMVVSNAATTQRIVTV